jgi:hypothetical protein
MNSTLGVPVPAWVSTVNAHLPATSAGLSCDATWARTGDTDPSRRASAIVTSNVMRFMV